MLVEVDAGSWFLALSFLLARYVCNKENLAGNTITPGND
jgi:hypothetical protein